MTSLATIVISREVKMTEIWGNVKALTRLASTDVTHPEYDEAVHIWPTEITKLQNILKNGIHNKADDSLKLAQEYRIKSYERQDLGRKYLAKKRSGYQSIFSIIRRIGMNNKYHSLDLENCHPRLLHDLCKIYSNYDSEVLGEYINNRASIRADLATYYGTSIELAKKLIIRLMFGGSAEQWRIDNDINIDTDHKFVQDLGRELSYIKNWYVCDFPEFDNALTYYASYHKQHVGQKRYDSALAVYLQNQEMVVMSKILDFLRMTYNIKPDALIHDAVLYHKNPQYDEVFNHTLLATTECYIKELLGYNIKLAFESTEYTAEDKLWLIGHDKFIPEHMEVDIQLRTDEVNAAKCLEIFANKIYNTNAGLYIYDKSNGIWTKDEDDILRVVKVYSDEIFTNVNKGDERKTLGAMYDAAMRFVKSDAPKIPSLDVEKNRGYFLFNNGVLDCMTGEMEPFNEELFFTRKINRTYDPEDVTEEEEIAVIKKIFDTTYTIPSTTPNTEEQYLFKGNFDTTKRDFFLEKLARGGILGGVSKEFLLALGDTNCGKGVLTQFIELALGEFVSTFSTTNLLVQKNLNIEDARRWAWVEPIWDRRLIIGNEIPNTTEDSKNAFGRAVKKEVPLNTDMIKTLVSGGDNIMCRLLYKEPVKVKMMALVVILANDMPTTHCDRAFSERALMMYADRSSTKNEQFDALEYFPADPTIKDTFIRDKKMQNAFVSIMCKYYQHSMTHGMLPTPDFVRAAVQEALGDSTSCVDWLYKSYIVYDSSKIMADFDLEKGARDIYKCNWEKVGAYYVRFDILFERYKNDGGKDSTTKFCRELTKHNFVSVTRKIKGKVVNCRIGIKIPEDEEDMESWRVVTPSGRMET